MVPKAWQAGRQMSEDRCQNGRLAPGTFLTTLRTLTRESLATSALTFDV